MHGLVAYHSTNDYRSARPRINHHQSSRARTSGYASVREHELMEIGHMTAPPNESLAGEPDRSDELLHTPATPFTSKGSKARCSQPRREQRRESLDPRGWLAPDVGDAVSDEFTQEVLRGV